ncbi:hypothetical protein MJ585_01070 [Klebsiella pneumoniae]|nr:hypothetical protein MJ585_01070 [Klebsiella pneumoniae]
MRPGRLPGRWLDDDQYHRLLSAAGLSVSWSRMMQKRRLSGKIEDSSREIMGK